MKNIDKAKPDVEIELGGKQYQLRYDLWAISLIKKETGVDFFKGAALGHGDVSVDLVMSLLWAGLQYHHPDVTLKDVGHLVHPLSQVAEIFSVVQVALFAAMGSEADEEEEEGGGKKKEEAKEKK